jgi:dienelactone hydrolase
MSNKFILCAASLLWIVAPLGHADAGTARDSRCPDAAYVTLEAGKIVAADWVEYRPGEIHTVDILTQSRVVDATIKLRPDQTAAHSSVVLSLAGQPPDPPKQRDLGAGAVYWSDFITSSVAQAVARAVVLNEDRVEIPAASLFIDTRGNILVERIDATDWRVTYHNKRYLVLTDTRGCMVAATLPDYGVTIERRFDFPRSTYPLWPAYGPPPDHAYSAQDVTIATAGHTLAGTLTLPPLDKRVPAAILITGLSPSERNNGTPPWMPFRDIADSLTRAGIAVLRVDDIGIGQSTGDHTPSTTFDEANDVRAEIAWLRAQPNIDPKRILLVGYSEGGLIAPMVASQDHSIAGIITLAGPGVPGPQLAREQTEEAVNRDPNIAPADREKEIEKELAEPMTPRESSFLAIDPLAYAEKVTCPALILQGGTDITVPLRSAEKLAYAMRGNGNTDVSVRVIAGVSHSFLPDPLGPNSGWVSLPAFETSPVVLQTMTDWIKSRFE